MEQNALESGGGSDGGQRVERESCVRHLAVPTAQHLARFFRRVPSTQRRARLVFSYMGVTSCCKLHESGTVAAGDKENGRETRGRVSRPPQRVCARS